MNFLQWTNKLGLQEESFEIIRKKSHPGISLNYNSNTNMWTITYSEDWDKFHLIHKLGYIWLWKRYNVLDFVKKYRGNVVIIEDLRSFYNIVMDYISYFTLANMDLDFKKEYVDYQLNLFLRAYNGRFPDHTPTITKIYVYVSSYLVHLYFFPDSIREKHENKFNYLINNLQKQTMAGSRKEEYPLTREIFNDLRMVLNDFDSVMKSRNYNDIINYSLQLAKALPYWEEEFLTEQFSYYT